MPDAVRDVLDTEPPRRRPRGSRGLAIALSLALLVAVGAIVLVDRGVRGAEQRAVARCAAGTRTGVDDAWSTVTAMMGYVRPVLDNGPRGRLRQGMYELISRSAAHRWTRLTDARRRCADTHVLSLHGALRARRDACVGVLDANIALLQRVARDGAAVTERWPTDRSGC